jgi:hypothetical protein
MPILQQLILQSIKYRITDPHCRVQKLVLPTDATTRSYASLFSPILLLFTRAKNKRHVEETGVEESINRWSRSHAPALLPSKPASDAWPSSSDAAVPLPSPGILERATEGAAAGGLGRRCTVRPSVLRFCRSSSSWRLITWFSSMLL